MLLQARWKEKGVLVKGNLVLVKRGQLLTSYRFISQGTGMSLRQTRTFISILKKYTLIETANDTGQTLITICNYGKYQLDENKATQQTTQQRHSSDTAATQNRIPDVIPDEKPVVTDGYFFEGEIVRLKEKDYKRWKETYSSIPDFNAALQSADDWLRGQAEKEKKRWFHVVSGILGNKHQKFSQEGKGWDNDKDWLV